MSEPFEIDLYPLGAEGASLRWRNDENEDFRELLMNQGNHAGVVKARGLIVKVASGTMTKDGAPATLIVFEFQFQTPKKAYRFKTAEIRLVFSDKGDGETKSSYKLDPVVVGIAPKGDFALNPTTSTQTVKKSYHAEINGGYQGLLGGKAGMDWEITQDITHSDYTSLSSTADNVRRECVGKENSAVWWLEENTEKETGIPTRLRTAVLLQRTSDRPFNLDLQVETKVNLAADLLSCFGFFRKEINDPVTISSTLSIGNKDEAAVLESMATLDLVKSAVVAFPTPFQTPAGDKGLDID